MRLIDGDTLWKKLEDEPWYDNADRDEIALPIVDDAPTVDAVPVVRCKECKWASGDFVCYRGVMVQHKPEDFCSYGERRGGADNG